MNAPHNFPVIQNIQDMATPPCCDANHHGNNQQTTYTPDKSEEELEFSDSVANPYKLNNWQRHRDQCVPWQTDTSPSDTFDNEESLLGSNSFDHSPSDSTSLSSHNLMRISPYENTERKNHDIFTDDENTSQTKELPIDNLLNNLEKTSSEDNSENYATPDASG